MEYTILIAGAGERGRRIGSCLKKLENTKTVFIDNNANLWNSKIEGIECFSIDKFADKKEEVIVLVSPENGEILYQQCKKIYINVIYDRKIIDIFVNSALQAGYEKFYPLGYFYSLYPMVEDVSNRPDYTQKNELHRIPGINFNIEYQKELLKKMITIYDRVFSWDCSDRKTNLKYRYMRGNGSISDGDAVGLFCMLNIVKPKRLIEVGSGHSSAISLDVNEYCFNNEMQLHFIEPYADRFKSILKDSDNVDLQEVGLQDIELSYFDKLEAGDILFIDSTHVSKAGSDVNYLFFEILPRLNRGVIIHLHDIFYPFEYPHVWIKNGMVWNELYLLRAFLQYNNEFEIIYFQNMIEKICREEMEGNWPFENSSIHGGSFWMRKK